MSRLLRASVGVLVLMAWLAIAPRDIAGRGVSGRTADDSRPAQRLAVDEVRAAQLGIRKVSGKRLRMFTDLATGAEIDSLPDAFDQAFPQWCQYFGVDPKAHEDWWVTGFVMQDKARFQRAGLLPEDLPPFSRGYSRRYELWLYDQPSDYYRRHLLLHEGTHAFMETILGGLGPPWYAEGIAEMLGTHRWQGGRLTLGVIPASREEVPLWGRIKFVTDGYAAYKAKTLEQVLKYDERAHRETEPYGWCWAAAVLLDRHPRYQERFRQLRQFVRAPDFNARFHQLIGNDWNDLSEEWQVFVGNLEYGHDIPRTVIDFTPGRPLPAAGATVTVAADRGWQNSGLRLVASTAYRLRATGRYQVANRPQIWWCEPNGVSIRYYKGRPLGILLGAIRPDTPTGGPSALLRPITIGLQRSLVPKQSGTLFLKINDSAGELADNTGSLTVHVAAEQ